ncbi:hypothetical protein P0136_09585 [Lentisphaerota bacterium ZTH]|nr:hypothetical protein JYG24_12900 [Lentisphaerota bacterium]WET05616.1 hypothetical protein P0136_09585 [Lentisphaerota bacterium ZTH]
MDNRGLIQFIVFIIVFGIVGLVNLYRLMKKRPQVKTGSSSPLDTLLKRVRDDLAEQHRESAAGMNTGASGNEIDEIKIYDEYGRLMTFEEPKPAAVPPPPSPPKYKPPLLKEEPGEFKNPFKSKIIDLPAAEVEKTAERADHFANFIREHGKNAIVLQEILGKPVALRD